MKVQADINLTPAQLAEAFADMDAEEQAKFLIEVTAIAKRWTGVSFDQWFEVGRQLRQRASSEGDFARAIISSIHEGTKGGSA